MSVSLLTISMSDKEDAWIREHKITLKKAKEEQQRQQEEEARRVEEAERIRREVV